MIREAGARAGVALSPRAGALVAVSALAAAALVTAALAVALPAPASGASAEERAAPCFACHGAGGRSATPLMPSIAGQPSFFVVAQLFLFRDGRRDNVPMVEAAKGLSDDDLRMFGDYLSRLAPPDPPAEPGDPARLERGRRLTRARPCAVCHNPDFSGREQMPRLAYQREDYLLKAMRDYKRGTRIGYGVAMSEELAGLTDGDLEDLAHFFAHLPRPAR